MPRGKRMYKKLLKKINKTPSNKYLSLCKLLVQPSKIIQLPSLYDLNFFPITQDDSASSLLGTKTYRIRNINVPVWEHGRSSAGTLLIALRRKATGSLL